MEISQNLEENNSARISFLTELQALACNFIEKETLTQAFSCEFSEISKTTFFHRTPPGDCFSTSHTSVLFQNTDYTGVSIKQYSDKHFLKPKMLSYIKHLIKFQFS